MATPIADTPRGYPALRRRARRQTTLQALPWLAPALILIGGVVVFPIGYMIYTSFRDLSRFGKDRGWAGLENYERVFGLEHLPRVMTNTVVWVVGVVALSIALGLVLAQFLDFFYEKDNYVKFNDNEGFIPATKSGAEAAAAKPELKTFLASLPDAKFYPATNPAWGATSGAFKSLVGQIQTKPVDDVLKQIQAKADEGS